MCNYPNCNVWLLIASPLEELDKEDEELWGTLEDNLLDDLEDEEYE